MEIKTAIIIVDVQNDFLEGGALAVQGGKAIIPEINRIVNGTLGKRAEIFTTQDWHPADHSQFSSTPDFKTTWPPHCIRDSAGAELSSELKLPDKTLKVFKGTIKTEDGYSAFEGDVFLDGFGLLTLHETLQKLGIQYLYVCGIATDYCVQASVLDAVRLGYNVSLLRDCIAGVAPDSSQAALTRMAQASVQFMDTVFDTTSK